MIEKKRIDVMVSSTRQDLSEYRQKVQDAILRFKWHPEMMEHEGGLPETALERSLRFVNQSDVYILLLGFRYGSIPEIAENPERLSYTELEYRHAIKRQQEGKLIVLSFLMDWHALDKIDQTQVSN